MRKFLLLLTMVNGILSAQEMFEVPAKRKNEDVLIRDGFTLSYNESYELSSFVAYQLTKEEAEKTSEVSGKVKPDPEIITKTGTVKDFKKTGYVTGQLVPAEHFIGNSKAVEQLYYMTNISPMKPGFYTKNWKEVEKLFRAWVIQDNTVFYIAAGPILTDTPFPTLGDNKISVPKRFYKVVLDIENERAIGFIFKNSFVQSTFGAFAVSIDDVEKETGIDFFPLLNDALENKLESTLDKEQWDWEAIEKVYGK